MSHRVIIADSLRQPFSNPEVRALMTPAECTDVDAILQQVDLSPRDLRELAHVLACVFVRRENGHPDG